MSTMDTPGAMLLFILVVTFAKGDYPFRNTSLPLSDRVNDLVDRLTLDEVMKQLALGGHLPWSPVPAIPRLGIDAFKWNGECERGANGVPNATAFAQGIGLAATFSPSLIERVMTAVSVEWRAYYNYVVTFNKTFMGLNCYSTTFNIMRDSRWGRNQETLGEDPYLTGHLCESYVRGLQGNNSRYFRVALGGKHFDAYSGPENIPVSRHSFDANVTERDLRLTFLPAFRRCASADIAGVMCTYTSLNGVPTCANSWLLQKVLRDEWKYKGYTVSDAGALYGIQSPHNYTNSSIDTATVCVKAGLNLEDAFGLNKPPYLSIVDAVNQGKLTETAVRENVKPLFYTRMKLGEFDPPSDNLYNNITRSVIGQRSHLDLAVETAMKTFVLLKNLNDTLPLKKNFSKIAVVGPMADDILQLFGNYHSDIVPAYCSTPLDGLRLIAGSVQYTSGCDNTKCKKYNSSAVKEAVSGTEAIFLCLGTGPAAESEGNDRTDLELPGYQSQLLRDVIANSRNGSPIILLIFNGGPLNLTYADKSPEVAAILDCFLPAQAAGEAVRRVLTMDGPGSVPAGRSPYTWPLTMDQITAMMDERIAIGKTLYPFGYGLSYSRFQYSDLSLPRAIIVGTNLTGKFAVKNVGQYDADEVVQVYISWQYPSDPMPLYQLVSFDRLTIKQGDTVFYSFTVTADQLAVWTDDHGWDVEIGFISVYAGGQLPYQEKSADSNVLSGAVQLAPF